MFSSKKPSTKNGMYTSACILILSVVGAQASSVTEGTRNGDVKPNSIICRYDYFAGTRTVLPAADLLRCSREPNLAISVR